MNIKKFHSLTIPQQHYYIKKCGTYLSSRFEKQFSVELYDVCGYYAEIFYEGNEEPSLIRCFHCTVFLDPYLSIVDIGALLEE